LELFFGQAEEQLSEGQRLLKEGKARQAVDYFNRKLALEPANAVYWRGLGEAYLQLGNGDFARRCFEESLKQNPGDTGLRDWLSSHPLTPTAR
jgi:Flp pilus assembly protein TadD